MGVGLLRDGKTHNARSFTFTNEDFLSIHVIFSLKYVALRPSYIKGDTLFMTPSKFKMCCSKCWILHNKRYSKTYCRVPTSKQILKVTPDMHSDDPRLPTLMEVGGDLLTSKRHSRWWSSTVAESCIVEESITRRVEVSRKLFSSLLQCIAKDWTK